MSAAALAHYHEQPAALERLAPPWETMTVLERSGDCYEGRVVLQVKAGDPRQVTVHLTAPAQFQNGYGAFRLEKTYEAKQIRRVS